MVFPRYFLELLSKRISSKTLAKKKELYKPCTLLLRLLRELRIPRQLLPMDDRHSQE